MTQVTHQTIKLKRGRHGSPEEGACVMELASMLAGEKFSDYPDSVCPVIGSLLRSYNDSIDDQRRQDLYGYAAKVVGSRGSGELEAARAELLRGWMSELRRRRSRVPVIDRVRALAPAAPIEIVGNRAVRLISKHTDDTHRELLALVDALLALGSPDRRGIASPPDRFTQIGRCSGAFRA